MFRWIYNIKSKTIGAKIQKILKSRKEYCKDRDTMTEVAQAAEVLDTAYLRYNHAEGYKNVKAAIYEIKAAELRLGDAVEKAKAEKKDG